MQESLHQIPSFLGFGKAMRANPKNEKLIFLQMLQPMTLIKVEHLRNFCFVTNLYFRESGSRLSPTRYGSEQKVQKRCIV